MQECTQHIWGSPVKGRLILFSRNQRQPHREGSVQAGCYRLGRSFPVRQGWGKECPQSSLCKGTEVWEQPSKLFHPRHKLFRHSSATLLPKQPNPADRFPQRFSSAHGCRCASPCLAFSNGCPSRQRSTSYIGCVQQILTARRLCTCCCVKGIVCILLIYSLLREHPWWSGG